MRQVLDHFAARLGAVAARLGAGRHVLVVLELLARLGALVVALRAALAGGCRERTVAGAQGGGQFAALRAIDAGVHALGVVFAPLGDQLGAVVEAGITMDLTVGTSLGALLKVRIVLVGLVGERFRAHGESGQAGSGCAERAHNFTTVHRNLLEQRRPGSAHTL